MKDSKIYAKKAASFFKKNKSKTKLKALETDDKIDTLIYSVFCEHIDSKDIEPCLERLKAHFVDWNDLRVSRIEEILDVLDDIDLPVDTKKTVGDQLLKSLNCLFEEYDNLAFDDFDSLGKRQANQQLTRLNEFTPFMVDFLMLNFKGSHSLPVNEKMAEFAREEGFVHPEADIDDIKAFLQRQFSVNDIYDFYLTFRQQAETPRKAAKKAAGKTVKKSSKTATKKKAAKKTTKKAVAKKPAAKKGSKKAAPKKSAAKKSSAKKTTAKKKTTKKASAKKTTKKAAKKTSKKTSKKASNKK